MTHKFVSQLEKLLKDPRYKDYSFYHFSSIDPEKRANAAYLMGAFSVLVLKQRPSEAWEPFSQLQPFKAFRDASSGPCYYACTILHCLEGLERATGLGWFDRLTFNAAAYEFNEQVENGDFNWIIPNKLLAFSAPCDWKEFTAADYVKVFKRIGIVAVVRLNEQTYDEKPFLDNEIKVFDLFFLDGTCPSLRIVNRFIGIMNRQAGPVAVHCKAGLGRTGTLIACYAMKKYGFPAEEFIAWARVCRPGSVLGPQQFFLLEYEQKLKQKNAAPIEYGAEDRRVAQHGDSGQAKRLLSAKRNNQILRPLTALRDKAKGRSIVRDPSKESNALNPRHSTPRTPFRN